jgi:hypothetical protein
MARRIVRQQFAITKSSAQHGVADVTTLRSGFESRNTTTPTFPTIFYAISGYVALQSPRLRKIRQPN